VGENTADNGGIATCRMNAFKLTAQGQDTTKLRFTTRTNGFFLSIATYLGVKMRDVSTFYETM